MAQGPRWKSPRHKYLDTSHKVNATYDSDGRLDSVTVSYPELSWNVTYSLHGLEISGDNCQTVLKWDDLPDRLDIEFNLGYIALYKSREQLMHFPMSASGPWSELRVPGTVGLSIWNGLLDVGFQNK